MKNETNNLTKLRVAFELEESGVETLTVAELEAKLANKETAWKYQHAEYVDDWTPYRSWRDVRRFGHSCRAYSPIYLR